MCGSFDLSETAYTLLLHHALKRLELKFGLSLEFSEFFDKIPVKILRDELFRVFRFSKASFTRPDISDLRKISMAIW